MRRLAVGLLLTLSVACGGGPPDTEMQQAQGAIDAARAAGADAYAHDEFAAAQASLKNAQDAVAQRDYRLALTYALDSRERAQNAAREAGDHKATARSDAERALAATTAALNDARAKLKSAEGAHVPPRTLTGPRRTILAADADVQEARTAFGTGDYLAVMDRLKPVRARLATATGTLDAARSGSPRRRH